MKAGFRVRIRNTKPVVQIVALLLVFVTVITGQDLKKENTGSIGGDEHSNEIYGVRIGMDVPSALEAVFLAAKRKPGQERPDALMKEGKGKKDIRVLYKDLPKGELQIVFAEGKFVKEIVLRYKSEPNIDDLRLPFTSTIGGTESTIYNTSARNRQVESPAVLDGTQDPQSFANSRRGRMDEKSATRVGNIDRRSEDLLDGARYDDRYTVGFFDRQKLQKIWWRDEKTTGGYGFRIYFIGKKLTKAGARFVPVIVQKSIVVKPGDEKKFKKAHFQ